MSDGDGGEIGIIRGAESQSNGGEGERGIDGVLNVIIQRIGYVNKVGDFP